MSLQLIHFSNCGPARCSNQDSYCIRACAAASSVVAMLAICDGMGGMNCGEIASATVISAFEDWYDDRGLRHIRSGTLSAEAVAADWNQIIRKKHADLREYARSNHIRMGTTLSAILIAGGNYYMMHVGDTRIYLEDGIQLRQLTKDQTLAMRELEAGRITQEEFRTDSRHNVLLQCVGDQACTPTFYLGKAPRQGSLLLCSDGFYHTVRADELHEILREPSGKPELQRKLLGLAGRGRALGETDNMTCVLFRWNAETGNEDAVRATDGGAQPAGIENLAKISFINAQPI